MHKRLNLPLSNGLCIIGAKIKEGSNIATLFITDFVDSTRVLFDMDEKRLVATKYGIDFPKKDLEVISAAIKR